MDIAIDASDLHPSTRLALEGLSWLEDRIQPASALDIGCGNGMLSLASAHLWNIPVTACDISRQALSDARSNAARFAPDADITVLQSDGLKHPQIRTRRYGLVLANLLAQWHVAMAMDIGNILESGGTLLLSGILLWQEAGVLEAFAEINLHPFQRFSEEEWVCDILCHKG